MASTGVRKQLVVNCIANIVTYLKLMFGLGKAEKPRRTYKVLSLREIARFTTAKTAERFIIMKYTPHGNDLLNYRHMAASLVANFVIY
jgi:hypothetical protein